MFYYEIKHLNKWWPCSSKERPPTKGDWIVKIGGPSSPFRGLVEVRPEHEDLSLDELRRNYGRFNHE